MIGKKILISLSSFTLIAVTVLVICFSGCRYASFEKMKEEALKEIETTAANDNVYVNEEFGLSFDCAGYKFVKGDGAERYDAVFVKDSTIVTVQKTDDDVKDLIRKTPHLKVSEVEDKMFIAGKEYSALYVCGYAGNGKTHWFVCERELNGAKLVILCITDDYVSGRTALANFKEI